MPPVKFAPSTFLHHTTTTIDNTYLNGMPFMNRLLDSATHREFKRQRTIDFTNDLPHNMPFFAQSSTKYLPPISVPPRKRGERQKQCPDEVDEFLSSDLELSFASNVSLNSPPREHPSRLSDCEPMDISPMPATQSTTSRLSCNETTSKARTRPRALTSGARLFGSDISNGSNTLLPSPKLAATPSVKLTGTTSARKMQRSALPTEWLSTIRDPEPVQAEPPTEPSSPIDDPMDVDTSYNADPAPTPVTFSPVPHSAAPTITAFSNLFFDTMSPRRSFDSPAGPISKKRRSLSPESSRIIVHDASSPMLPPSSPSESKLERMSIGIARFAKPTLQGLGAPSANFLKRPRRPVLSEMLQPSDHGLQSAYPVLSPGVPKDDSSPAASPPVRRAFSALLPPSIFTEHESDESSFEGHDLSSPAQAYSKRQQVKTIRRCDGTEDFRPLTGATAMVMKESPSSRVLSPGLPGFGDNEASGKILPCHRVTEDGLMRIKSQTLDHLLNGKYDSKIHDYHIIDCRFDYEYSGGHIPGAVNINTTTAVEELLLGPSLTKPRPSVSGDAVRKTVLVFHCEFSAKRAPTFAKHLRAKDRAINNHAYPKIHYPEVYILEGGYCQYFKSSGHRCEPPAYVTMDDPNHILSRREDLDQFRKNKFGRHKSYAYGDGMGKPSMLVQQTQPKRNTAPSGTTSLFAAATAARSRRGGSVSLMTLAEDANVTVETEIEDTDTDLGDSPCPPPTKATVFKAKKTGRSLVRAETYGPTRMPY